MKEEMHENDEFFEVLDTFIHDTTNKIKEFKDEVENSICLVNKVKNKFLK